MIFNWINSVDLIDNIYIPKYYDPTIKLSLRKNAEDYILIRISEYIDSNIIEVSTGDEIGKLAYGTGSIPFIRTSDISNWEIKSAPKQGVSDEIYNEYNKSQDVQEGDILLVRDGTYLIGTNCFVTSLDSKILYQSHLLKFRIKDKSKIDPYVFFIALNSIIVQKQIRAIQFTADIIDTIGNRYHDIVIPYPKDPKTVKSLSDNLRANLEERVKGKAFIKEFPVLIESVLAKNSAKPLKDFFVKSKDEISHKLNQDTITAEFGNFEAYWHDSEKIINSIFLPKYYEPSIKKELRKLSKFCNLKTFGELKNDEIIDYYTGIEVGKMAYGTGDIAFIRTSDFSNWEIQHNPKQGISVDIYEEYAEDQDVRTNDIFLVRDGTYLVGSSCIVTETDSKCLFCGGLYKIRVGKSEELDPFLLLGLMNSYIVKRQIRTKQFTRDVIDTIGHRIDEVVLPIPMDKSIRQEISQIVSSVIQTRIRARNLIKQASINYFKL